MKELYGPAAVLHQTMALVGSLPDSAFMPQHVCSNPCEEGGVKVAVRWIVEGRNTGWGLFGAPTGHAIRLMGMSHFHLIDDRFVGVDLQTTFLSSQGRSEVAVYSRLLDSLEQEAITDVDPILDRYLDIYLDLARQGRRRP